MPRPLQFRRSFLWLMVSFALLLPVAVAVPYAVWFSFILTPLQKEYLGTYMSCSMLSGTAKDVSFRPALLSGPRRKPDLAHNADVSPAPDPTLPMALSPEARAAGWTSLKWDDRHLYRSGDLAPYLQAQFFDGKSLAQFMLTPALERRSSWSW